jgi:multiple sugar transport system ATP-binding protein
MYGDKTVVPDLSFEIKDKEFVVLVGPSGCGKSTTLRMIAGLEEVSAGELFIGERLINNVAPKDRDIAMVFQNYALYPHMTVYKNMAFGLSMRKVPKNVIDEKVKEAAEKLNITEKLQSKPKDLSGGQRQRVALGRAMVREPSVFLLDEPLSNLDAKLRTEMRANLISLQRQLQTTFVYVTHDQTEAMTMADRIVVLKDGLLQQYDTPQVLYDNPCNKFVAGFIGSPEMNFLDAVITDDGASAQFAGITVSIPQRKREALAPFKGKAVTLGIRPEDIHWEPEYLSAADGSVFDGQINIAELMGSEIFLYMELNGVKVRSRVPMHVAAKSGDSIKLTFDMEKSHFFENSEEPSSDPDSEKTITN